MHQFDEMDYTKDVQINENKLDLEWKHQSELVLRYNMAKADAMQAVDCAKEEMELCIAAEDAAIRSNGEGKKLTEALIAREILLSPAVKAAKQKHIEAKHDANIIAAACAAIDTRGQALTNLVKLWAANYFAEPQSDVVSRAALQDKKTEEVQKAIRINRKK